MSWGVQVTTEIYVTGVTKNGLKDKIKENEEIIIMYEKELLMLAAASPREIASDDSKEHGEIIEELRIKVDNILESYKDCISENRLLNIILEDIDKAEDC